MHQIKPQSILDPPQIKPETTDDQQKTELERGGADIKQIETKKNNSVSTRKKKIFKRFLIGLCVFLIILTLAIGIPGYRLYRNGLDLYTQAKVLKDSVQSQDINILESQLANFSNELNNFEKSYHYFAWSKFVPFVGAYYKDGENALQAGKSSIEAGQLVITTIKPYADIIGFAGGEGGAQSGEETANDRIDFLIQSLNDVLPQIDAIAVKAQEVQSHLEKIDADRYPEDFRGIAVSEKVREVKLLADEAVIFLTKGKPLIESAPYLLGVDSERTYLLLFQNDKELRPTGGFITAYSIMRVNNGKVESVASSDIYNLDGNYKPNIEAPNELRESLGGVYELSKYYYLRDMNWNPDYKQTMELFLPEARKAGISEVDGVIAVDTKVVEYLLDVIGPIGVPGFGNFSTENDDRCNCPQVIYELESFADNEGPVVWSENEPGKIVYAPPNYDNRKKIIGPLMNSMLSNALGQPKEKLPDLFEAAWKSTMEKHVLVYLLDENAQKGAEGFGITGTLTNPEESDYLMIVDANLGGRKSNLYVTQEVNDEISIENNQVVHKLTLTYKNPQDYDGWLNSVLPNWTRVYVPEGASLISADGFDSEGETYSESGKTVFSGGFELRPQGVRKITLEYSVPLKFNKRYNLYIQKQPGTDKPVYAVKAGKKLEEFFLITDRQLDIKI